MAAMFFNNQYEVQRSPCLVMRHCYLSLHDRLYVKNKINFLFSKWTFATKKNSVEMP